jgi:DNA polymerase/3'-5' exonuclease PolX
MCDLPLTLRTAATLALELHDRLEPACARIEIAGSVRRRWRGHASPPESCALIKDIEIVCEPRPADDPTKLFGDGDGCAVENLLAAWRREGLIQDDPDLKRDGPRYKRFVFRRLARIDLFLVRPPASWGATLVIRTGDADFSKLLVTSCALGGVMPAELRVHAGGLCRRALHAGMEADPCTVACRVVTETEAEFFAELGFPLIDVERRNRAALKDCLSRRRKNHAGAVSEEE